MRSCLWLSSANRLGCFGRFERTRVWQRDCQVALEMVLSSRCCLRRIWTWSCRVSAFGRGSWMACSCRPGTPSLARTPRRAWLPCSRWHTSWRAIQRRRAGHRSNWSSRGARRSVIRRQALDVSQLRARRAYVLDGLTPVGTIVVAAPHYQAFSVRVLGRAAHAGVEPERGVSAMTMAAQALMRLPWGRAGRIDDRQRGYD